MKMEWTEDHDFHLERISCKWALPLQAQSCVGSITSRKNCEACENWAIRRSQIGSVERRTFTLEQQSAQLDFILQENESLMWYDPIIIIKVDQKLLDLFQGTRHSQTFNKVKKSLWPSPLLKLKACFFRQADVVPPQPVEAKVTVLYVAVHLNLRPVITEPPTVRGAGGNGLYCIKLMIISLN